MKTSLQILTAAVALSQWPFSIATARAEENWINLTLESSDVGSAPSTQSFSKGTVQTEVASLAITDKNRVEVVKDAADSPGKALRFIKTAPDPRCTPWAILVSDKELATSRQVSFHLGRQHRLVQLVAKFPGFEALLNLYSSTERARHFSTSTTSSDEDEAAGHLAAATSENPDSVD